jgi:hypothetical protein
MASAVSPVKSLPVSNDFDTTTSPSMLSNSNNREYVSGQEFLLVPSV